MDLSLRWLNDYIDVSDMSVKDICAGLTMSGSKVEKYDTEGSEISKVVVAKILDVKPHSNSDHLVVTQVDVGTDEPVQIVTGAPNITPETVGMFVPAALDGSTLPGGVKIKKGKLRGEASNGMLCSLGELGLTLHDFPYAIDDGIFILKSEDGREFVPGMDIHDAIDFNDTTIEFEITPNRPDCLSVLGLARETHATFERPLNIKEPSFTGTEGKASDELSVEIVNKELCSRYMAAVVHNVKIGPSPLWLRERLRASGVRPINNLVDITNFVMLEYGHPMHAFDIRYINGSSIKIRSAENGEKITTLDGIERTLSSEMLVIADAEKPVAVAGVMGGEYSGIMDDTVTVVFEAACFNGASVRTTAKKLGMRTDASSRFEKELDPRMCAPALMRACELVEKLGCGEVVKGIIDCSNGVDTQKTAPFDPDWINRFLGTEIHEEKMLHYLSLLDIKVKDGVAYAPAYRGDIEYKNDLAEEVARLYGYNNIPKTIIRGIAAGELTPAQKLTRKLSRAAVSMGAYEICTFSFVSPRQFDRIRLPENSPLRNTVNITNPLGEDTSVMRTTLLPSMCEVLARNYNNRNASAFLYEIGNEYIPNGGELPDEPARLIMGAYGDNADFYFIKGAAEKLFDIMGIDGVDYEPCKGEDDTFLEAPAFHPGRCAVAIKDGVKLAILGELHPETLAAYDIGTKAYAAKFNIPEILAQSSERKYKPLPKFPATTRDLAVVCDDEIPVAHLEKAIAEGIGKILENVKLFDIYKGSQIESGKKSAAFSITMRSHEGTLTDEQADAAVKKALKKLAELGAVIRE
ncbi:MAG: phenylalanine--tRNA ligase subunit beta [Oscillospiraceae bacterium]|nr:phenylalanine--tRNA ligase subunit beta [Oscillospiraceae bacterium]